MIANVTAEVNRDPERVRPLLLEQITAPVRWEESMARLAASGATSAIEFGAGRVLAGLMRRINKGFKVRSVEDRGLIEGVRPSARRGDGTECLAPGARHGREEAGKIAARSLEDRRSQLVALRKIDLRARLPACVSQLA